LLRRCCGGGCALNQFAVLEVLKRQLVHLHTSASRAWLTQLLNRFRESQKESSPKRVKL
jgi:hypothetical protein